jgi:hypothetical protein
LALRRRKRKLYRRFCFTEIFCFCLCPNNLKNQQNHQKLQFSKRAHFLPIPAHVEIIIESGEASSRLQSDRWRQKGWSALGG